jgi:hypothetical protein
LPGARLSDFAFRLEDNLTMRDHNSRSATFREKIAQARNT